MRIGLLLGREKNFPQSIIANIKMLDADITVEMITLGGNKYDEKIPYTLIVDRISHLVPYYRLFLKSAKLSGIYVINNPSTNEVLDLVAQSLIATKIGILTPKMVSHITDLSAGNIIEKNLFYPTPWIQHVDYLNGFPIILRATHSINIFQPKVVSSMEELVEIQKGEWKNDITIQEFINYERYLRCLCIGKSALKVFTLTPGSQQLQEHDLPQVLINKILLQSQKLAEILDYDLCSFDWGVWEGQPYLIDLVNPIPDLSSAVLDKDSQDWCFSNLANFIVEIVKKN